MSKYTSKPEIASDSYHHALSTFCHQLLQNLPAERAVQSLFAKMASDHNISAQEAVHLLLCKKLVGCSCSFVNLNADIDAGNLLTDISKLDDDDIAFKKSFFQRYETRPTDFSHLNAVEYCSLFDVNKHEPPFLPCSHSHTMLSKVAYCMY